MALAAVAAPLAGCHPAQQHPQPTPKLTATALPNILGGNVTEAFDLDARGRVTGRASYAKSVGGHSHAMLWENGAAHDLGTLDNGGSEADVITQDGKIYGWSSLQKIHIHGVAFGTDAPRDLGVYNGAASQVVAADRSGKYILTVDGIDGATRAYLFDGKTVTPIGPLPGYRNTVATAMNDDGLVVGMTSAGDNNDRAFSWQAGRMEVLPLPPGSDETFANAVNASGVVVGTASEGAGQNRAVVWDHGQVEALPSGPGKPAEARAINDAGDIVGTCNGHACLWRHGKLGYTHLTDLNSLAHLGKQADLAVAVAINNHGQIACNTSPRNGIQAYLLQEPDK